LNLNITEVTRLNGANSVWRCTSGDEHVAILKNYTRDNHAQEHYFAEAYLLEKNSSFEFLPKLIHKSDVEMTSIFRYEKLAPNSRIQLQEILSAIFDFSNLLLPDHLHRDKPGICGSWAQGSSHLGTAENLVLAVARKRPVLAKSLEAFTRNWNQDSIVHGDLKLANTRIMNDSFKIIDWETVGFGSKFWDAAGLVQSLLMEIVREGELEDWSRNQMGQIKNLLTSKNEEFTDTLIVRMVQSSVEAAQRSTLVPRISAAFLQLAEYIALNEIGVLDSL